MPPTITLPQSKASGLSLQRSQRDWVERRLAASGNTREGQQISKLLGELDVTGVIALQCSAPDKAAKVVSPASGIGVSWTNNAVVALWGLLHVAPVGGSLTANILKRELGEISGTVINATALTFADGSLVAGMILGADLLDADAPSGSGFWANVLTIGPSGNEGKGLTLYVAYTVAVERR